MKTRRLTSRAWIERAAQSNAPELIMVATTDWQELEKHRFVGLVAAAVDKLVHERKARAIVVVAPPHTLADLRHGFHDDGKSQLSPKSAMT